MHEPVWVLDAAVEQIHRLQIAEHGGLEGIRDANLLNSALWRPKHLFSYLGNESSLTQLAATYAFGIARNHPFIDGNKRTAFVVCLLFLRLNGFDLIATQDEKYEIFLALAEGRLSEDQLSAWLSAHVENL